MQYKKESEKLVLIAGGDVEWSLMVKEPGIYFGIKDDTQLMREDGWRKLPHLATPESIKYIEENFDRILVDEKSHHISSIHHDLEFETDEERDRFPFLKIREFFKTGDITMVNLETPLADKARNSGDVRTPTSFAKALKWAGIDVVSLANNHVYDCEGAGMDETLEAIKKVKLAGIGLGKNLEEARKPFIFEKNGIKIAILSYTYGVNPTITPLGFALPDRSGAAPMDPFLIREDIIRLKNKVDFIILALHWGIEDERNVHPAARDFAHDLLDAGADCIIGHHPHVPRGIEVYKGKSIIHSLGNFIFGHNHTYWGDNILTRITFSKEYIEKIEIFPIAGEGKDVAQPYILNGDRAQILLKDLKERSAALDTEFIIDGEKGIVYC